jgi:hypothetical protein
MSPFAYSRGQMGFASSIKFATEPDIAMRNRGEKKPGEKNSVMRLLDDDGFHMSATSTL